MTTRRFLLLSALATLLLMPLAFAFGAAAATLDAPAAADAKVNLRLLIPVIVPVLISGLKLLVPHLPKVSLPVIAIVLGAVADFALSGFLGQNTLWGAVLGAAGTGLREVVDQVKKSLSNIGN